MRNLSASLLLTATLGVGLCQAQIGGVVNKALYDNNLEVRNAVNLYKNAVQAVEGKAVWVETVDCSSPYGKPASSPERRCNV